MRKMTEQMIKKRDGRVVPFDSKKIYKAVQGVNKDTGNELTQQEIDIIVLQATVYLKDEMQNLTVEKVQDAVESALMSLDHKKQAKAYILYRQKHAEQREATAKLMNGYNDLLFADSKDVDLKRDNANINTDAPMGIMLKLGTEGAKCYADHFALPEQYAEADRDNYIHIHDKDFSFITFNCCQIDLGKLLKGGFSTGHGFLREPNSIRAAASLACIAIQSDQNDMFGGQSINALDYALAPYVNRSYTKYIAHAVANYACFNGATDDVEAFADTVYENIKRLGFQYGVSWTNHQLMKVRAFVVADNDMLDRLNKVAMQATEDETKQAMEAMIHNFNTLHSRAGKMCA